MGKRIVNVTSKRNMAIRVAKNITKNLKQRKINREAYVCPVSQSYVKTLTRKGIKVPKRNYAVCVRNKR